MSLSDGGLDYTQGSVMKVPLGGGTATTLATGAPGSNGIAVDAMNVYWTVASANDGGGSVMSVPIGGGSPTLLASASTPTSLAVDSTSAYWIDTGTSRIMKVALDGGAPTVLAGENGNDLAIDSTSVYWTTGSQVMKTNK